jgi:O-acetylserine/cysteine efflux transporter
VLAAVVLGERPTQAQSIGIGIAAIGLLMICATVGYDFSLLTFAITMISPVSFSIGNLLLRQTGDVAMFDLVSWLSLLQVPPLLAIAFVTEGPYVALGSVLGLSWPLIAGAFVIGLISTSAGYFAWGKLLRSYTPAQVVPFALLVPFTAAVMSWIVFGDIIEPLRLAGMLVVVAGIAVMLLLGRKKSLPEVAA